MNRALCRLLSIVIIVSAILPFAATSPVYATSLSKPACISGTGTNSIQNLNLITRGSFQVQAGDVVVGTIVPDSLSTSAVELKFGSILVSFSANISTLPVTTIPFTATAPGTVSGLFGSSSPINPSLGLSYHWSLSLNGGKCPAGAGASTPLLNFNDGRCNQEPWQSFAVYPDNKGGFVFYTIYQGVGYYALHVTEQTLDDNPDTGVNHIIAQSNGVQLWRLAGGLLQAHRIGMDGKDYSFDITCGLKED